MQVRFLNSLLTVSLVVAACVSAMAQEPAKPNEKKAEPTPTPTPAAAATSAKDALKNPTAEQIAETSIFVYGNGGGRALQDEKSG